MTGHLLKLSNANWIRFYCPVFKGYSKGSVGFPAPFRALITLLITYNLLTKSPAPSSNARTTTDGRKPAVPQVSLPLGLWHVPYYGFLPVNNINPSTPCPSRLVRWNCQSLQPTRPEWGLKAKIYVLGVAFGMQRLGILLVLLCGR